MKDIVVIGDIMIDIVAIIKEEIHRGSDTESNTTMQFGGAAANVATWLGIQQQPCRLVGAIGKDLFGELFAKRFSTLLVKNSLFTSKRNTGSVIAISHPDNERSMLAELGANIDVQQAFDESFITENSIVYISGYVLFQSSNADFVNNVIARARKMNATLVLDPASSAPLEKNATPELLNWLRSFDYMLPNEQEHESLQRLGYQRTNVVVEKRGSDGVIIHANGASVAIPAEALEVVDTVGAGDAFAAGFLSGLARGFSPEEAAKTGIKVASKACRIRGATPGVLDIK